MDNSVIHMSGVTKAYKDKTVLNNLNFDLTRGSVTGLLGKNGAGKTTLIKSALGLIKPQSGEIRVMDEAVWDLSPEAKARLGYVPQEPSLYEWMKVGQMLDYIGAFYPEWNRDRVMQLLSEWEIDAAGRIKTLSVGQKQKLAILAAIGHEPELLVFDEPVANLDPMARRQFLKTILDIAAEGDNTVLFSTHITSDLERVADRVAVLKGGKIVFNNELDVLKDSVKRLHIASEKELPAEFAIDGTLHADVSGSQARVTVQDWSAEKKAELETKWNAEVTVEDLNLEDIFLEMHG